MYDYPGFPSLFISYSKFNDFFYSGHCGLPVLCALEAVKTKNKFILVFAILNMCSVGLVLIVTRGHYTIDIISGIIVAHYLYKVTDKYIYLLDNNMILQIESAESREYEKYLKAKKEGYNIVKDDEEELKNFGNAKKNTK